MSKTISSRMTAVAFAIALILASTAEAGPFAPTALPEAPSAWSLAWEWLAEVWGNLTGLQGASTSGSGTAASMIDAGCGIDPNGAPLPCDNQ